MAEIAALTGDELVMLDWAERHLPRLLGALGITVLAAGTITMVRHRRRSRPVATGT